MKKTLSLLIVFTLTLSLCMPVVAQAYTSTDEFLIYNKTTQKLHKGGFDGPEAVKGADFDGEYSVKGDVLELNGFTLKSTAQIALGIPDGVSVALNGVNTIEHSFADPTNAAGTISAQTDLRISKASGAADAKLNLVVKNRNSGETYPLSVVETLAIDNCDVSVDAGSATNPGTYGAYAGKGVEISGKGTLSITNCYYGVFVEDYSTGYIKMRDDGKIFAHAGDTAIMVNSDIEPGVVAKGNSTGNPADELVEAIWLLRTYRIPDLEDESAGPPAKYLEATAKAGGGDTPSDPSAPSASSYTVSASAQPTAGGSVTGAGNVASGSNTTLTATPNEDYAFLHWLENGAVLSTANPYTFPVTSNRSLTAVFEKQYTGENANYYDPTTGTANPTYNKDGFAIITLNGEEAKKAVGLTSKGVPQGRVALHVASEQFEELHYRITPEAFRILQSANVDALELRSDAMNIYFDKAMLKSFGNKAIAENKTFRILVQPKSGSVTVQTDLNKGDALAIEGGLLRIRIPMDAYADILGTASYYDSANKELVFAPKASGTLDLRSLPDSAWNSHWAASYIQYAVDNGLMTMKGGANDAYADADGKTYTRGAFAAKVLSETTATPRRSRDAYSFTGSYGEYRREIITLQQIGAYVPLSDGSSGGNQTITNAQAAAILSRLAWLEIDPLSPYRWETTDDGQGRMYYSYNCRAVTGSTRINGQSYDFGNLGIVK